MRAAVKAVGDVLSKMRAAHGVHTVGDHLETIEEVLALQSDYGTLETAQKV